MYDAKEVESLQSNTHISDLTEGNFIADRGYFQKIQNEKLTNLKSSYVPRESLINNFNME